MLLWHECWINEFPVLELPPLKWHHVMQCWYECMRPHSKRCNQTVREILGSMLRVHLHDLIVGNQLKLRAAQRVIFRAAGNRDDCPHRQTHQNFASAHINSWKRHFLPLNSYSKLRYSNRIKAFETRRFEPGLKLEAKSCGKFLSLRAALSLF